MSFVLILQEIVIVAFRYSFFNTTITMLLLYLYKVLTTVKLRYFPILRWDIMI